MSTGYAIAYALGLTPWERAGEGGAAALDAWFARVESEVGGPGRALDLGCGSGMHTVALARRGWRVTGVDAVGKAVRAAQARIAESGVVGATVVQGDVTELDPEQVGTGNQLVIDIGCFHGLRDDQRLRMGRTVSAVAAEDAWMIMLAFRPGAAPGPLPRGADGPAIESAFAGWQVVDAEPAPTDGMPRPLRKAAPMFYLLRR
jgi:SAM-dependent methyltransferase